jgi:hypothetical protein
MQFVDIAVAFGYGLLCLSLIVAISPVVPRETAVQEAAQTRLDVALSSYVERVGVPFLNSSQPSSICESAEQQSNSSFVVSVLINGDDSCGGAVVAVPVASLATVSLALSFPGRTVLIRTWLLRS